MIRKVGTGETQKRDFLCASTGYVSIWFFGGTAVSDCLLGKYGCSYLWFESISRSHVTGANFRALVS
jgi:hypothetical protein